MNFVFPALAAFCLTPLISSGIALLLGITCALTLGNPYVTTTQNWATKLLQASVIGLGAGVNLHIVAEVGIQGAGYTALGIVLTLAVGLGLGRLLGLSDTLSTLISAGTAICGGSAIAAVSSSIRAKPTETSVSLAVVFCLNAIALFLFPVLGHWFGLTGTQFGFWSALAIHDTSSVVGAALQYGKDSVEIATTVKLARALWIVPVVLFLGRKTPNIPWFIFGFIGMAALTTWAPEFHAAASVVYLIAQRTLVMTLFLIGANLSKSSLTQIGVKPLIQGVVLWVIVASVSLMAIINQS